MFRICHVFLSVHCGHLLRKGYPLGSFVCDVLLCICNFPMWCPGSGVVLDCIDFCILFVLSKSRYYALQEAKE